MLATEAAELRVIVVTAAAQVLPSCGIAIGEQREPVEEAPDTKRLVAVMGFSGALMRGSLTLVAPVELMKRAYPLPLQSDPWELDVFDWSGEVANRLLGRIKNELAMRGVDVDPSTPRVLYAERLHAVGSMKRTICSISFMTDDSWIEVWFDAIAAQGRAVLLAADPKRAMPSDGDVLLFD
jgi:CheY-specific phosphatase CheX